MAINVNTNTSAMIAQRYLNNATDGLNKSMERLSSGYKINSAKDDAAGLQISNRLQTQNRGLDVAVRNANDGISIAQTAEGAMKETSNILQRMRDLSLQAANGSNSAHDRKAIQEEMDALTDELNRIAETTSFGGTRLLNGTFNSKAFQIGADSGEAVLMSMANMRADDSRMGGQVYTSELGVEDGWMAAADSSMLIDFIDRDGNEQKINIEAKVGDDIEEVATYINGQTDLVSASVGEDGKLQVFLSEDVVDGEVSFSGELASQVGLDAAKQTIETVQDIDVNTVAGAQKSVSIIDSALAYVDSNRAELGAIQNRFIHSINNLDNINENVAASNSRIKDVDFAKETTQMMKERILQRAGVSVLAQAKEVPIAALSLLS
ncbi:flagellin [Vibrio sp. Of7-15]|uniref:flagellin n=1 Tax=Vibrio sp. Of7-15 TaxID=2724879 RepID=UPI001EF380BE|nr:flagellin [Vibrio sp. Of7-15]MCG7499164.1 flagellin [Vibrio sp. Of7-15]